MQLNEVLEKLPRHLMSLVIDQPYNEYTAQDHAVWRYVMRQNVKYLSQVAHGSYVEGLKRTGISIDEIPHMYGMNRILREIGWAAVAVDGFIPPSAFMEFQAYNVLVIAADIRPISQIEYTPAPDIIHEAAGHAPIIADSDYAAYLSLFGEIGSKAFSSAKDYEQYEAIRHLSILKADPYTPLEKIAVAEKLLEQVNQNLGEPSEMSLIRNLHWWTVEYGLIGDLKKPKIYGAGLLSSIGESMNCMKDSVKKIPYSIDAVNYGFDITTQQPQLFVTPDFEYLTTVLHQFADRMALKRGGLYGIRKAIGSKNTATCVYSSGLQVSGTFDDVITSCDQPVYLIIKGPAQLCYEGRELDGHGIKYHHHGFGSPVGAIKDYTIPPELLSLSELESIGIKTGETTVVEFESGLTVRGILQKILRRQEKNLLFSFTECTVTYRDRILFQPSWGVYDMAVGESIVSAYSGPADADAFGLSYPVPVEKTHKIHHSEEAKSLHQLYSIVRNLRNNQPGTVSPGEVWSQIKSTYTKEWLLALEILEIVHTTSAAGIPENEIREYLKNLSVQQPELNNLINNGLSQL